MTRKPRNGDPVAMTSADLLAQRIALLQDLFPEAFCEGKVDPEKLGAALGTLVDDRPERYTFSWAGKRDAQRILQIPTRATLVPCPKESVGWEDTGNLFIEGDNLEVLKLLLRPYYGRVKMIYIDPPYNTGNDFVYPDNYADPLVPYLRLTGQADEVGNLLTSNPEMSGRYHSTWLSMMYPRLFLARQLLREDGVIFVSIDDNEVYNLRLLMNEVFGEENFVESFVWKKSYGGGSKEKYAVTQHEYILLFARNLELLDELWLPPDPEAESRYYKYQDERGPYRLKPLEATKSMDERKNLVFPIPLPEGGEVWPQRQWWWSRERVERALAANELVFTRNGDTISVSYKQYLYDENGEKRGAKPFSVIDGIYTQHGTANLRGLFDDQVVMQFPKPVDLMKKLINMATEKLAGDYVVDFFAGSCVTAQATLEVNHEDDGNRHFLAVQLPEPTGRSDFATIAEIGKERIRRVLVRIQTEDEGRLPLTTRETPEDLGFRVFKLASSNYRTWSDVEGATPEGYTQQLELFADPLVEGWTPEAVIAEVALKEAGFGLEYRVVREESVEKQTVYRISDPGKGQFFYICLDDRIDLANLQPLSPGENDLFICRDGALDDTAAANLALQYRLKTI